MDDIQISEFGTGNSTMIFRPESSSTMFNRSLDMSINPKMSGKYRGDIRKFESQKLLNQLNEKKSLERRKNSVMKNRKNSSPKMKTIIKDEKSESSNFKHMLTSFMKNHRSEPKKILS